MKRILFAVALCVIAAISGAWTLQWGPGSDWPAGTTVNACLNGVCVNGITGNSQSFNETYLPGTVLHGTAQAVPPAGYQCGDPLGPCPPSAIAEIAQTIPSDQSVPSRSAWVFIVNGNKKGWVKRNYIRPAYAAPFTPKAENDEDFSGEQKKKRKIETTFFQESVAYSRMEGELYESPSEDAERFGRIEKGDELQIIKRTVEGKWFNIRIQLTGEEGWVPEEMIRFEDYDNVGVSPRVAFEVQGAFLTKNIGLGGGAMGAFNLWPHGAGDKIRDRLELGITYNFHANTYQTTTGVEIKRTTHVLPLELRYMPSASLGRFFAIVSGGPLLYFNQYTSIASEAQLKASSAIDDSFVFALSLGAGAGFCVNENFYFSYHVRLILRTALVVGQTFGIGGRF